MIQYGGDVSNFTPPLTVDQQAFTDANWQRVCIGLQNSGRARDFQRQFAGLNREYYIERPNRDLTIPEPGSFVWIDVEEGCIVTLDEIRQCKALILGKGLKPCIYGNETSIKPVIGESTEFSDLPLIYANYGAPDFNRFRPFNGWTKARCIQYSSDGVAGINCDLDMWDVEEATSEDSSEVHTEDDMLQIERYEGELNSARALKALTHNLMLTMPIGFDPQDPHTLVFTDLQTKAEVGRVQLPVLPDYDQPS